MALDRAYSAPNQVARRVEVFESDFPIVGVAVGGGPGTVHYLDGNGAVWTEHRVMGGGMKLEDSPLTVSHVKEMVALYHQQRAQQERR